MIEDRAARLIALRSAVEHIKVCVSQQPLPRDLAVQAALTDILRRLDTDMKT